MDILIGAVLALGIALLASVVGFDKERGFYPLVTIFISSYYVLFAVMGGGLMLVISEAAIAIAFCTVAIAGFKKSRWLIVAALTAHGIFDFVHGHIIDNPGAPSWWPHFCLAYDLVAAAYLAIVLRKSRPERTYLSPSAESSHVA